MKSCLDCKHAEKTLFEEYRMCVNEKSAYYYKFVSKRDLCRYWEGVNEKV